MIRSKVILPLLVMVVCVFGMTAQANAHALFKKLLAAKYPKLKINCNKCHLDKQPKSKRNVFGQLYTKMMGIEKLTETYKTKKGPDKKEYETEVLTPAFEKAYEKMKKMTYDDMIKAGILPGVEKKDE